MPHSNFTVFLAIALGGVVSFAFTLPQANGYPSTNVSLGSNPIVAYGGSVSPSSTSTVATAPSDQRIIITDVILTVVGSHSTSGCTPRISIDTDAGTMAEFRILSDQSTSYDGEYIRPTKISHRYESGIPVEPGSSLGVTQHGNHCEISYSLSGYIAQP